MQIMIKGIRIKDIDISRGSEGAPEIRGNYELISTADVVLAKQGFNGYNDIKLESSLEVKKQVTQLLELVKADLETTLGLAEKGEK